jgi:shikimate dehydrogenase
MTARSPRLWDAACAAIGSDVRMLPLDVDDDNLAPLLDVLAADPYFLGGSVAVPHKQAVLAHSAVAAETAEQQIGAVNNLFRASDGALMAANTDGDGALASIEGAFGPVAGQRVVLLGLGGTGRAVAVRIRDAQADSGTLVAVTRSPEGQALAGSFGIDWLPLDAVDDALGDAMLVVNCTSVGHDTQAGMSPLGEEQLALLPADAGVFDVIYNPRPTRLLELAAARGLRTVDGLEMNLLQAVIGFRNVFPAADPAVVRAAMAGVDS